MPRPSTFDVGRALIATLVVGLGIAYQIWPEKLRLDTPMLVLIGFLIVLLVLPVLEELELPGSVKARFRRAVDSVADDARALPPSTRSNGAEAVGEQSGLPAYLDGLAAVEPAAASEALRGELEDRLRATYELTVGAVAPESTAEVVRTLLADGFLDITQAELIYRILRLARSGAHGDGPDPDDAEKLVDVARQVSESVTASTRERVELFERAIIHELRRARSVSGFRPGEPAERFDVIATTGDRTIVTIAKFIPEASSQADRRVREARVQAAEARAQTGADAAVVVVPDYVRLPAKIADSLRAAEIHLVHLSELAQWLDSSLGNAKDPE